MRVSLRALIDHTHRVHPSDCDYDRIIWSEMPNRRDEEKGIEKEVHHPTKGISGV
jgi:hypothetical protein